MSGWHHHGEDVTMGYVLKGSIALEFGPGGSQKVEIGELVISRVGEGQLVFPVDGPEAT